MAACPADQGLWNCSIDTVTSASITGWVSCKGAGEMPPLDLWADNEMLASGFRPTIARPDVKAAGLGEEKSGFAISCQDWAPSVEPVMLKITIAGTGKVVGFRLFDLARQTHSWERLEFANRNLELGNVKNALCWYYHVLYWWPYYVELLKSIDRYKLLRDDEDKMEVWHKQEFAFAIDGIAPFGQNDSKQLIDALNRMYTFSIEPHGREEILTVLAIFKELLDIDKNAVIEIAYRNFISHYILSEKRSNERGINFFQEKLGVFIHASYNLSSIREVLRTLPLRIFEILAYVGGRDLESYQRICPGIATRTLEGNSERYRTILLDFMAYGHDYTPGLKEKMNNKTLIGYGHSIWDCYPQLTNEALIIAPTLGHIQRSDVILATESDVYLSAARNIEVRTCELAYTGPCNEDGLIRKEQFPTQEAMRREAERLLGCSLSRDRPLLFYISGGDCNPASALASLSDIAKSSTVIYRPFFHELETPGLVVPENILVNSDFNTTPNIFRFAADYVLANINKGSFLTCVIFGIPVIPYYNHCLFVDAHQKARIGKDVFQGKRPVLARVLKNWPEIFDISRPEPIRKTIASGAYLAWFKENITRLQKEIFVDWHFNDAVQKTAEYIVRFASEGTLGKDCAGLAIS